MARFGTFKFGERKFGAEPVTRRLSWALEFDWDNDGLFDGSNAAMKLRALEVERGRTFLLANDGGFEPFMTGRMTADVYDPERMFDPYNESGPLFDLLAPGRRFRLRVRRESDGVVLPILAGEVDDMRPDYSGDVLTVRFSGVDDTRRIKNTRVRGPVTETIRYDDAIKLALIDAGITRYEIDTTVSDSMRYWWMRGNSAHWEIRTLVDAALGAFWFAADGTATYRSRLPGDSPVVTLTDFEILRGVRVLSPWESVRNLVRVYVRSRTKETGVELWRLQDVPQIPGNESREIWAQHNYNNEPAAALDVYAPVAITDYTANSASDGSGTNLTSNITVTSTRFAQSTKIKIANTGATLAYITLLRVRGDAIVVDKYTFAEQSDDESIGKYRQLELDVQSDWLQDVNSAIDQAYVLLQRLKIARKYPRVRLKAAESQQFVDLFDLVTINFAKENISQQMRVGYIKHHTVGPQCDLVQTDLYFEPDLTGNVTGNWIFPAVFGSTTVF